MPSVLAGCVIIPFLKKDKDPQSVDSYRPIALKSTICKLLERMIVNRLSWWLEEHSLLSPWQAGFRKGRSTVDQCLRLSQHISDGFQSSERQRTGMTLFDFSKAYDRVWRTGLLLQDAPSRYPGSLPGVDQFVTDEPTSPRQGQCQGWAIENFQGRSPTRISFVPLALRHIY